jgi:ribonuclease J
MFKVAIQAAIGGKIIARDNVREIKLLQEHVHDALGGLIYDRTRRRPMILPVVVEV